MDSKELKNKLSKLWKDTFHDSDDYVSLIFDNYYDPCFSECEETGGDVVAGLEYLGFKISAAKNDEGLTDKRHALISASGSKPIYVIATDETAEMLRRAKLLLNA